MKYLRDHGKSLFQDAINFKMSVVYATEEVCIAKSSLKVFDEICKNQA